MDEKKRAEYVERLARYLEGQGEARITGRIHGHLMTATEPYLSLQELSDQLGVSRASVSTGTRRLIEMRLIDRVPVPGSRGEHYSAAPDGVRNMMERAARAARDLVVLMEEGVELQRGVVTPGTQSLRGMAAFYAGMADHLEKQLAAPKKRKVAR